MNFFGFAASLPPPPKPPRRPPAPPLIRRTPAARAPVRKTPRAVAQPSAPPPPSIVGRWKEPSGSDLVEFREDGALIEQSAGGDKIQGRYALLGDQLKIQLDGVEHLAFSVRVDAENLELRDVEGQVTRYQRVP
ncbi:MAG: hypothetical protein M3032_01915 [Verrucomicrobiota bacterium]|nr:hypothetical protein [Verrucomicrobiota bacterium]